MYRVLIKEMTVEPSTDSDLGSYSDCRVHCKAEGDNVVGVGIWSGTVAGSGAHMGFLVESTIRIQTPSRFSPVF